MSGLRIPQVLEALGSTAVWHAFDAANAREWDDLLARADPSNVFLSSGWLRAWLETLAPPNTRLIVPHIRAGDRLVAAGAFVTDGKLLELAGKGPSDYGGLLLAGELDESAATICADRLLVTALSHAPGIRQLDLARIVADSPTFAALRSSLGAFHTVASEPIAAPCMSMERVDEVLKKKSLRRHENGLARLGTIATSTFVRKQDILPQLDEFCDQHVARWAGTDSPSLFLKPEQRAFYRAVTERLDETGALRFTTVRLNGELAAGHFGFLRAGRFIWYKPTYAPALAKHSPGEVLIKQLMQLAKEQQASVFDFTIGNEAFKARFATSVRQVHTLHVTSSAMLHAVKKIRATTARYVGRMMGERRWQRLLRSARQRLG